MVNDRKEKKEESDKTKTEKTEERKGTKMNPFWEPFQTIGATFGIFETLKEIIRVVGVKAAQDVLTGKGYKDNALYKLAVAGLTGEEQQKIGEMVILLTPKERIAFMLMVAIAQESSKVTVADPKNPKKTQEQKTPPQGVSILKSYIAQFTNEGIFNAQAAVVQVRLDLENPDNNTKKIILDFISQNFGKAGNFLREEDEKLNQILSKEVENSELFLENAKNNFLAKWNKPKKSLVRRIFGI